MIAKVHGQLHEFFGTRNIFRTLYGADANIQCIERFDANGGFYSGGSEFSHGSPLVLHRVGGRGNRGIATLIADRRARLKGERNDAGPDRQSVVRSIVFGRPRANFRGNFREWQAQNARGFQFFFVGLARIIPAAGKNFFGEGMQRYEFFFRRVNENGFSEGDDGAVVHRVVEDGTGQNESVSESNRDADGN